MFAFSTREEWLGAVANQAREWFKDAGYPLPKKFRVSCGLPHIRAFGSKRRLGECWTQKASRDKINEIFISPTISDSHLVSEVLIHELCHAAVGVEHGHKAKFKACALAVGLEGKMTSTNASFDLKAKIETMILEIGKYPHADLDHTKSPVKKQSTRLIKVTCPEHPDYVVRMSSKWIEDEEFGCPVCPACGSKMVAEQSEEEEEQEGMESAQKSEPRKPTQKAPKKVEEAPAIPPPVKTIRRAKSDRESKKNIPPFMTVRERREANERAVMRPLFEDPTYL